MGRPSPERRQAKRKRQKVRRKLVYRTQNSSEIDQVDFETELHENEGVDVAKTNTREGDIGPIGGADTDLVEMSLYDNFREQDGEEFSLTYLVKCRKLLIAKVKMSNEIISQLQSELEEVRLESKKENKRIRQYFELVAYGHARAGRMVRSALSSAPSAEKIIQELGKIYSPSSDIDDCTVV